MASTHVETRPEAPSDLKQDLNSSFIPEIIEERRKDYEGKTTVIQKYSRGKLLGKGGFAKCFIGTLLSTKSTYALKIVAKSSLTKSRAKQKLQTEIKIHKTLAHEHVVRFERYFEDSSHTYIVLELCIHNSMSELMKRRKKLTELETKYYLLQLVRALEYLHANCIIHRDLKLGNLFISSDMQVKVGDFGLATRVMYVDERKKTVCGTPNYIAPEILEGKDGHSYEVDIWSTGVIVYTLLVGRPPFESKDVKSTYKRILANSYSFPEVTEPSSEARSIIRNMLQQLPQRRIKLSEVVQHSFMQPMSDIPLKLSSSYIRQAPSTTASDLKHAPKVNDENDPRLINHVFTADIERPISVNNGVEKRPFVVDPTSSVYAVEKRPFIDTTGRESRCCTSPQLEPNYSVGRKQTIRSALSTKYTVSNAASGTTVATTTAPTTLSSRLAPSTYTTRSASTRPPTTGTATQKFEIYCDPKPFTARKENDTPVAFRTSSSEKSRAQSSSTSRSLTQNIAKYSPPSADLVSVARNEAFVPNSASDLNNIQMDLDNVQLVDKTAPVVPITVNKRKPTVEHEAWGWNDDDDIYIGSEAQSKPAARILDIQTPKYTMASGNRNPGTIESIYGTLNRSFAISTSIPSHSIPVSKSSAPTASVWVTRYVDYTSKYGMGFLLNTGSSGVHFNDSTKIVLSPDGNTFEYIERKRKSSGHMGDHCCQTYDISEYPQELHKKVTLLKHFGHYLVEQENEEKSGNLDIKKDKKLPEPTGGSQPSFISTGNKMDEATLPFLKKWVRTKHAILFRLSNKTVQVVFFDKSEVLLSSEAHVVTYVDKSGIRSEHSLQEVLIADRADIAKRLKYTKDIMYRLISMQSK